VEQRFRRDDWLKAIGGILFLVAALLPWWEQTLIGFRQRQNAFSDVLGLVPTIIYVAIAILTIVIKTDSLSLPMWLLHPLGMLIAAIAGAICVAVRFFLDPFSNAGNVSRGLGLYLAGAAAVISIIGCVIAYRERAEWYGIDDDGDEVDEDDDAYEYGYDPDEQDDLIRRINSSLDRETPADRPPRDVAHPQSEQERRRAARAQRTGDATTRRRRAAGPPIP
jgi:hypothetical protein